MLPVGQAAAQGIQGLQGLGQSIPGLTQPQTPEERQGFCRRVAAAAGQCLLTGGLGLDVVGLTGCLVRTLPPQDSLRMAQVAQRAGGSAGALLGECGIGAGR